MSTDDTQPIEHGLSPFFRKYFYPYGCNLYLAPATHVSRPLHTTRSSAPRPVRSLSASTRRTETLRKTQKASIVELFGSQFAFNDTIMPRYGLPPLGAKFTPTQFLMALCHRIPAFSSRSPTSWPAMPAYQTPLELPNTDLACIFRPDFPFDFCLGLWSIYGMLVNSGIESWVTQMICKGKVESIDTTAPYILTNAYSDYPKVFAETYDGLMAKYGSLLETFVDDATQDTWDPRSGKPKGLSTGPMSSFLLLETRLGMTDFANYCLSNLRWDSEWACRLFTTCEMTLPHPGDVLPGQLQDQARQLLCRIGDLPPDANFQHYVQHIIPVIDFFLGESTDKMVIRIIHTIGIERLCVALLRKGSVHVGGFKSTRLFPLHIISFAASLLLIHIYELAYCMDMNGVTINEHRGLFNTEEASLFMCCRDTLENLWNTPTVKHRIEAKLAKLMKDLRIEYVLRSITTNLEAFQDEGYVYSYAFDFKPSPVLPFAKSSPVFTLPPQSTTSSITPPPTGTVD